MSRRSALALLAMLPAFAGCSEESQNAATTSVAATTPAVAGSKVFTVPAELPQRAKKTKTVPAVKKTDVAAQKLQQADERPASDAQARKDLAQALGTDDVNRAVDQAGLTEEGYATVPPGAPPQVAAIITAANQVARAPYRYGGGHGGVKGEETWVDSAYDCSGSVSFAMASAGLLDRQMDSTSLMSWGEEGQGKWVTVYANAGHAFMVVAGLRFDTVERARTGTRWGAAPTRVSGFAARHPKNL